MLLDRYPVTRFLIIFRSHASGLADEHFVRVSAPSVPAAIAHALRACPPFGPWAVAQAVPWPRGCRSIDQAIEKTTGTSG